MRIAIFFFGAVIGFWIANFLAGKKAGEEGRIRSLKFIWRNYVIHIHHWLWALIILMILFLFNLGNF